MAFVCIVHDHCAFDLVAALRHNSIAFVLKKVPNAQGRALILASFDLEFVESIFSEFFFDEYLSRAKLFSIDLHLYYY